MLWTLAQWLGSSGEIERDSSGGDRAAQTQTHPAAQDAKGERLHNGSSGEYLHLTCLNVSGSNSCTNTQFPGRETFREEREHSDVMSLSSQCPLRRDVPYIDSIPEDAILRVAIDSIPEDAILRVAIDRGKMSQHPPTEPNYITRGDGHIVWEGEWVNWGEAT